MNTIFNNQNKFTKEVNMRTNFKLFLLLAVLFAATNIFAQVASVTWPLTSNQNPNTSIGNIQATPQTIVGTNPSMILWPLNPYSSNGQSLVSGYQQNGWPAGPVDSTRYIQFDVSPTSGNTFTAQYVSFKYGDNPLTTNFNLLKSEVWYSFDGWNTKVQLNSSPLDYLNTAMQTFSKSINVLVANGQTFSLRIFLYTPNGSLAMTPTLAIHNNVIIEGRTSPAVLNNGSICGIKFNDSNGNGVKDPNEVVLPNWKINLTYSRVNGTFSLTDTTDANGNYCFNNLSAGTYTVSELNQSGWQQTFPTSPGTHAVTLTSGQNIANLNFGNKIQTDACITWSLLSSNAVTSTNGNVSGQPQTIGVGTSPPFMSVFLPYSNGQRLWTGNTGTGWPAGTQDTARFIQFNASPTSGNNLTVTNVSFNYGDNPLPTNFNILNFKAYYSTDNWATSTVLNSTALVYLNSTMLSFSRPLNVLVPNGQTFSLRIYPYSPTGSIAMTPSFAIHNNVVICGTTAPSGRTPFCTDFEDSSSGGWQVNNAQMAILQVGSNRFLQTTDQSGPSFFFNDSPSYTGNWGDLMVDSCGSLCFDINYLYNGNTYQGTNPPLTMTPSITIEGNGFRASFIASTQISVGTGWYTFCAPLKYLNSNGTLPSNSDGHWVMNVGTPNDWNSLLSNVTRVRLPVDPTSFQSERIGYDNICIKNTGDCNPPSSICGVKFNDLNGNGVKDLIEPGLANWTINLSYNQVTGLVNLSTTTDSLGNYCFRNLSPRTYTVSETNRTGWQQTFPTAPGTHSVTLTAGQNLGNINFGNRLTSGFTCDSLSGTATRVTPGDCVWNLSLNQPANLTGVTSIQILALAPNLFTTGTGLGTNFQNWFTIGPNNFTPPSGIVPSGNLNNFFRMNLNYVTSPQTIVVNWLNSAGSVVCADTLLLNCQAACVTIRNDSISCSDNNYNLSYSFTNNATYAISNIEYTLQSPSTVSITPAAVTLSPNVLPNSNSGIQNIQLSGAIPGDTVKILAKFKSPDGCCWCYETIRVIIPSCATVCDSISVQAQGSATDCNYSITLTNNSSTVFSNIEFELLSGGMFSTITTTSSPGWGFTNVSPNNLINLVKFPPFQGIGQGTFNNVLNMSIRQYSSSSQVIEVRWIKDGEVICRDTLRFECVTPNLPTDSCSQVINGSLICLPNGTIQYNFQVQNNSNITSSGFGIYPSTPGITFSQTNFPGISILPGQVSPMQSIIISGAGQGENICFQTAIYSTITAGGTVYNYCCHSNVMCIVTPTCGEQVGSICGIKFNDLNGNGVKDPNEPTLQNWTINLAGATPLDPTLTARTDTLGRYCFTNLRPGLYTVSEVNKNGWTQTAPSSITYSFLLRSGQNLSDINFGNKVDSTVRLGSICGIKFNDINGNGVLDNAEPGLPYWTITLTGSASITAVTDVSGNYCFDNLKEGNYTISEVYQNGWVQTAPSTSTYSFVITAGQNRRDINFGNRVNDTVRVGSICGIKFNDINGNGVLDDGETGLPNWPITLVLSGSAAMTTVTDARGNYCFTKLKPGSYTVSEVNQSGWIQTAPSTLTYSFNLGSGQNRTGINFGNKVDNNVSVGSICGIKYNDLNGNGVQDRDEPGLPEWQINIGGRVDKTVITDRNGNFCFTDLPPGDYKVAEEMVTGWIQTAPPSPGVYNVLLGAGQRIDTLKFGNRLEPRVDCVEPPRDMVLWLSGDEIASDISGLNNNGRLLGDASYAIGKVDNSFIVKNFNDYISIPNHSSLNFGTGNFSIDAWVKTKDTLSTLYIAHKIVVTGNMSNPNLLGYVLMISQGGKLALHLGEGETFMYFVANNVLVADGNWHFVAVSVDRKSRTGGKMYVDGNLVLTFDPTNISNSISNSSALVVAKKGINTLNNFSGQVDELEIFNRAITAIEVASIYNAGSSGKCKPLGSICGIKFNDVNGNGVQDGSERRLSNWQIKLTGPTTMTTTTDEKGNYCFRNLPEGTYRLEEVNQVGWNQTAPASPGYYTITLTAGQNVANKNFGNRLPPCNKVWTPLGSGLDDEAYCIVAIGTDIYAGGDFTGAGGIAANRIAKWNGTSWSPLGSGVNGPVYALTTDGTNLYVGGQFTTAGGVSARNIAKWNGTSWSALGSGINGSVESLARIGTVIYAGGDFNSAGGVTADNIAQWNGTSWSALGSGINADVVALATSGTNLYAGGFFTYAGGISANNIAKWDGSSWSALGSGVFESYFNSRVRALAVKGTELYVGGYFTKAGGLSANFIAKWNISTSSWSPLGSGISGDDIWALATIGSDLYAGGQFSSAGSGSASRVAKWDGSTLNWSALGTGVSNIVRGLAVIGTDLYACGRFTTAGGVTVSNIAKYACSLTSVGDEENSEQTVPQKFQVEQNYPNPFNPSSKIRYDVPITSFVKITVYDILGKEISVLVNEEKNPGRYETIFDGRDLASGVYFYTIRTGNFMQSKKMILMK
ncbi:MAG: hypothetical protein C0425_08355 [Chlorobiaceae bacterium]|nr:hypothetical protein [Chlorobiaceae bacterium]MBA4310333.1 hypothetical protein [Chlorobiaceae bacterium]